MYGKGLKEAAAVDEVVDAVEALKAKLVTLIFTDKLVSCKYALPVELVGIGFKLEAGVSRLRQLCVARCYLWRAAAGGGRCRQGPSRC
jgi:hypothetical protein